MNDFRLALRTLRTSPGFALTAILTLALGIGLATAVFTVADALLLRRLPVQDQDRLVVLWGQAPDRAFDYPFTLDEAREFARQTRALTRVAFFAYEGAWPTPIREGGRIARLRRGLVSGEFFDVLGAQPVLGRALNPADDVVGAAPVLVLSHRAWQGQFSGDPKVLGRQIVMHHNGVAYTIVGVMPQGLDYPRGADMWAPLVPARTRPGTDSTVADVEVIGRLRSGAAAAQARAELTAFFARLAASPWQRDWHGVARDLPQLVLGETRPALFAFAAAACLLLLITCINVANLLLVRGLARVKEIAVRSALGAGPRQVVGQLLAENALLALAGGAFGVVVAAAAVRSFVAVAPPGLPRLDEIQLNATALAGAVVITCVAMLIFGLAPAFLSSRVELEQVLRSSTRQSVNRRSRLGAEALVAGQVALALLVLSAAGLIVRSVAKLERAELSFEPSHLLIGDLALRYDQFDTPAKQRALLEHLLPAVQAIPGVRAVSPVVAPPFSGPGGWDGKFAADGQSTEQAAANPMLNMEVVTPDYFATLGVPVRRGRVFTDADREGAPLVVVVSESVARLYWGTDDPIGKRLRIGEKLDRVVTVVGVVPDTRYRELREARPTVYFPLRQPFFPFEPVTLAIRTTRPPTELVPTIRRVIDETEPGVALVGAAPFGTYLEGPLAQPRLNALLLALFASAAAALAAVGLFGAMATMVRQRTRELGVRMALGATGRDLRRMVMRRGFTIAGGGAVLGLFGALLATRLLAAMLYEVTPTDPATLTTVVVLLLAAGLGACYVPARQAMRVDPIVALRTE